MRNEGLGRHLAEFLKASTNYQDVRFVIAAPKWMRQPLAELFKNFDLDIGAFEIITPRRSSVIGIFYGLAQYVMERRKKIKKKIAGRGRLKRLKASLASFTRAGLMRIAKSRNIFAFAVAALFALIATPFVAAAALVVFLSLIVAKAASRLKLKRRFRAVRKRLNRENWITRLSHTGYRLMCDIEAQSVADEANKRRDIAAWYAPAAFWPEFNQIKAPRVMCVPDVVPIHFSVAFATEEPNGERLMQDFKRIESAIEGGDRFITYSHDVKDRTLSRFFHIGSDRVSVIPHGANRLDHLIKVSGFRDNEEATDILSAQHFWGALAKSSNNNQAMWYSSRDLGFLFYASQIRPNKNVMTLLKAYYHLRRTQNLPYKLLMTGDWSGSPEVKAFMNEKNLHDDVLFIRGLNEKELASCYRLATLAVNPSLAEGGMPFTFTEAVSVGTPAIMADIPVSREILDEAEIAAATLFDAYDYKSVANAIITALDDRDGLRRMQEDFFERRLAGRTWVKVVSEYIAALNHASDNLRENDYVRQ